MTSSKHPFLALNITTKNVTEPNGAHRTLFQDLRLTVQKPGTSIAITGRSGSGKTTLLRILAGLDLRYHGTYSQSGAELQRSDTTMSHMRRRKIGMVTQKYDLLPDRNVRDNILIGDPTATKTAASELLAQVGLTGYEKKRIQHLSGGEAQRVAIARALIKKPEIILADEPTGALDALTEESILSLLQAETLSGTTLIYATHSDRIAHICDHVLLLENYRLHTPHTWTSI